MTLFSNWLTNLVYNPQHTLAYLWVSGPTIGFASNWTKAFDANIIPTATVSWSNSRCRCSFSSGSSVAERLASPPFVLSATKANRLGQEEYLQRKIYNSKNNIASITILKFSCFDECWCPQSTKRKLIRDIVHYIDKTSFTYIYILHIFLIYFPLYICILFSKRR